MMIKDISRFINRDPKKSILLDPNPINFLLSPENGLPIIPYNAEMNVPGVKDNYFQQLSQFIEEFMTMDDVRPTLKE